MNPAQKHIVPLSILSSSEEITDKKVFKKDGVFCGYTQTNSEKQTAIFDNYGHFCGYSCESGSKKLKNKQIFDEKNSFLGYVTDDEKMVKYDENGNYKGYYLLNESGNISEYNDLGQYTGYYSNFGDGRVCKFDALGRMELVFE